MKYLVEVMLMVDADSYEAATDKVESILASAEPCRSFILKEPVEAMEVVQTSADVPQTAIEGRAAA